VTGASKGIGHAVTRALAAEGAHVTAGARTGSPDLQDLVAAGSVDEVQVDLSTREGPADLVAAARVGGPIDVLVNNVGVLTPHLGGFLETTEDDWSRALTLTLMAAVRTTRAALPGMLEEGRGTIVTVSSINAFLPDPTIIEYCAAKAALTNFSKALSKEVGPRGIRVNTVSPGPVSTDLWLGDDGVAARVGRATGGDPEDVARQAAGRAATGRFTAPAEVADLVVMLAGDRAGNVTGADLVIDGGYVETL